MNPSENSVRQEQDRRLIEFERQRVQAEYQRRAREIDPETYAPWNVSQNLILTSRRRIAAAMLHRAGVFPQAGDSCLEIGFGWMGWLGQLISWGVRESDLHGIDLNAKGVHRGRGILPLADLREGDAAQLPWPDSKFHLVIQSTVFSSVLNARVRQVIADEITRVLLPGGALLWYDLAINNPSNPHVHGLSRAEIRKLFPRLQGSIRSLTLAPPISRAVAPKSWLAATFLECIPLLRTHLLAVLIKKRIE